MSIEKDLNRMKKKTGWSWERFCREMHRVKQEEGPSHTTLFRYATRRVRRPNVVVERYIREGLELLRLEAR